MNQKEKAKQFAINAHKGQIRKNEKEKPYIIHPLSVGLLLESYGYDEELIIAGYLHDVVEDTKYTIEDIKKKFGNNIAELVTKVTEPDKTKSWEERKQYIINQTKTLPLKNKLVICADKINNLEDIMIKFQKNNTRDFSAFNRGEEKQKWYYENIYQSLIFNEDKNIEIFQRLKKTIDIVFNQKEDKFIKDYIYKDNQKQYENIKILHAKKEELKKLKALLTIEKPFIIEFIGTPNSGKTTIINRLYNYFKEEDFNISIIEDITKTKYYEEKLKNKIDKMGIEEKNIYITEKIYTLLLQEIEKNKEIILLDNSINQRQILNYQQYLNGNIQNTNYQELKEKYQKISQELINYLIITYTEPYISLKRKYTSNINLLNSSQNLNTINTYNNTLEELNTFLTNSTKNSLYIDTTNNDINNNTIYIANQILPIIRKKYIKEINKKYNTQ